MTAEVAEPPTTGPGASASSTSDALLADARTVAAEATAAGCYMASLMPLRMSHTLVGQAVK